MIIQKSEGAHDHFHDRSTGIHAQNPDHNHDPDINPESLPQNAKNTGVAALDPNQELDLEASWKRISGGPTQDRETAYHQNLGGLLQKTDFLEEKAKKEDSKLEETISKVEKTEDFGIQFHKTESGGANHIPSQAHIAQFRAQNETLNGPTSIKALKRVSNYLFSNEN